MKILVDLSSAQPIKHVKITGGGEYSLTLLQTILESAKDIFVDVVCNSKCDKSEKLERLKDIYSFNLIWFSEVSELESLINLGSYDKVVLPVCYSRYAELNLKQDAQVFTIIHDLCELYYYKLPIKYGRYVAPSVFASMRKRAGKLLKGRKKYRASLCAHKKICSLTENQKIITVTNYSKSTLIKYLNVKPDKISVFYTPKKLNIVTKELDFQSIAENYGIHQHKYFLLLAGSRWEKNNGIVLKTLDNMFSKEEYKLYMHDFKVVLLGVDKPHKKYYGRFVKNEDHFIFDNYVNDESLIALYKNAYLFIFPSCLEGFGMPPLEAIEYGTVPACSTSMSIPEVCGDAAIYFDPYDINSIELSVLRSFDKSYMNEMREKGRRHYIEINHKRESDLTELVNMVLDKDVHQ